LPCLSIDPIAKMPSGYRLRLSKLEVMLEKAEWQDDSLRRAVIGWCGKGLEFHGFLCKTNAVGRKMFMEKPFRVFILRWIPSYAFGQ